MKRREIGGMGEVRGGDNNWMSEAIDKVSKES